MRIEAYSDGSGTEANKAGGYGWVLMVDGTQVGEGCGHLDKGTNNDCEMMGAIVALTEAFKYIQNSKLEYPDLKYTVTLCSDSQIVLNWANGSYKFKQEHKMDKYRILRELMNRLCAQTQWVKGHSGQTQNTRCDELANLGRLKLTPQDSLPKKKVNKRSIPTIKPHNEDTAIVKYKGLIKVLDFKNNTIYDYK